MNLYNVAKENIIILAVYIVADMTYTYIKKRKVDTKEDDRLLEVLRKRKVDKVTKNRYLWGELWVY